MKEWKQSKDTKKLEIAGDNNSERLMSYEEYLKILEMGSGHSNNVLRIK